jgi:outer membrane protein assembly factor BamB
MAVAACYLMNDDLLVVEQTGLVYCMARRDLTPRWVSSLKAPLDQKPAEGPTHYVLLVQAADGAHWLHAWSKQTGAEAPGFPRRLPYAASAGVAATASYAFIASLGRPGDARTLDSVSLVDGNDGWGWRTSALLWASPQVDPSGGSLILAAEDGVITSVATGGARPDAANWMRRMTAAVTATPAVSPDHVVVGSHDGIVRCLDLSSGEVLWLEGIDAPIKVAPWILGSMRGESRSSGIEGAPDIAVQTFQGAAFVRNRAGLFAFDVRTGTRLFEDPAATRPIALVGDYVLTIDRNRNVDLRDSKDGYKVKGRLKLGMFDLVPTNSSDGAVYGVTHDGAIVAAIPNP